MFLNIVPEIAIVVRSGGMVHNYDGAPIKGYALMHHFMFRFEKN
jgi:hypothetical protein